MHLKVLLSAISSLAILSLFLSGSVEGYILDIAKRSLADMTNVSTSCSLVDQFQCANGKCIPSNETCDWFDNCGDKSDEENCPVICSHYSFKCNDGTKCLNLYEVCDGKAQCLDRSDEQNCAGNCTEGQFKCRKGNCIPSIHKCDYLLDCSDFSDEDREYASCTFQCPSENVFRCPNGHCSSKTTLCDDENSCHDGTWWDEQNCPNFCKAKDRYRCPGSVTCIWRGYMCDGVDNCPDQSDEENCEKYICPEGRTRCCGGTCQFTNLPCIGRHERNNQRGEQNCTRS